MCQAYSPCSGGSGQRVSSTVMVQPLSRGKVPGPVISRREKAAGMLAAGDITSRSYSRHTKRSPGRLWEAEGEVEAARAKIWSRWTEEIW